MPAHEQQRQDDNHHPDEGADAAIFAGGAVRLQVAEDGCQRLPIAGELAGRPDAVGEGDDGGLIVGQQAVDERDGGLLRRRQGVALHAAARVHHHDDGHADAGVHSRLDVEHRHDGGDLRVRG